MKKQALFWIIYFLFPLVMFGWKAEDVKDKKITHKQLKEMIREMGAIDQLKELERWKKVYPGSFEGLDWVQAYFEIGKEYYDKNLEMLALKTFLKGFEWFGESSYKTDCAFYLSKIFYKQANRESALYYINKALVTIDSNNTEMMKLALDLKKRIRWQYFSMFEGLPDNSICDIEFDGDDVWIGMWTGGIARFTRSSYTMALFRQKSGGLISDHVRDIEIIGRFVWVGTYGGLCRYDKMTGLWDRPYGTLKSAVIKKLKQIDGRMYAATIGKGLFYMDILSQQWAPFFSLAPNVTDVLHVSNKIYIATLDNGIYFYQDGKFRQLLPGKSFKCLIEFEGKVWAGSYGEGIYIIDPLKNEVSGNLTKKNGMTSDMVESMCVIPGKVIVGSIGGGVNVYHADNGKFNNFSVLQGLPSPDVVEVVVEKHWVWFGTLSGGVGILLTENFQDI
jgi:ligand-binding sensor domain-containing protein